MTRLTEQFFTADVLRSERLTPVMQRVVVGGPGLTGYTSSGVADEWFRLLVPPSSASRWYSVRRFDADRRELTFDVVLHEGGVASAWAERARPGDQVTVTAPVGRYAPPPESTWELVVADQTGVPSAVRILEELPPGRSAYAILEAPNPGSRVPIATSAALTWLDHPDPRLPSPLDAAVRGFDLPEGPGYVWMAGESRCARSVRRYLRHELGWPAAAYAVSGYWRPQQETYERRYAQVADEVATLYERGETGELDAEQVQDAVTAALERRGL